MRRKVCLAGCMLSAFGIGVSVAPSFMGKFLWGLLLFPVFLCFMVVDWVMFTDENREESE